MSNTTTTRMLRAYVQMAAPTLFLSGFFKSPPENFYNTEKVEIDIERSEEDVSIVITDLSQGYRMNADDLYTNKSFLPPINKEAGAINAFDMIKRQVGQNPFDNPNFQANAILQSFKRFRKFEGKIKRSRELQGSQILQSGIVSLVDSAGIVLYTIDYKPKATHFPTVVIDWDSASSTKAKDLEGLADTIRADGLADPQTLVFDDLAFSDFINDSSIQALLNNRRINIGSIRPQSRGAGATYQGEIAIGNYVFQMWTYNGRYKHPQTGVSTKFMQPNKVIMLDDMARLDATFGAIPKIVPPEARALPFLPPRISDGAAGVDLSTNAWVTADGEQVFVGAGIRQLLIPTAIDTYGCLTTKN